jgi:group I intron endonuclease
MDFKHIQKQKGIYKITNNKTKKFYIGSSVDVRARLYTHLRQLRKNQHYNKHLQSAFNKYKESEFSFNVLKYYPELTVLELREKEQECFDSILDWDTCYNIDKFANCQTLPKPKKPETIEKIVERMRVRGSDVYCRKDSGIWKVYITVSRNNKINLGSYNDEAIAREVKKTAEFIYWDNNLDLIPQLEALRVYARTSDKHLQVERGKGITKLKNGKYFLQIKFKGKFYYRGVYSDKAQAIKVRSLAESIYLDNKLELLEQLNLEIEKANRKDNQKHRGCGVGEYKGKFWARITVDTKVISLGNFDTKEEAKSIRDKAEAYYYDNDLTFEKLFTTPKRNLPMGIYDSPQGFKVRANKKHIGTFKTLEAALEAQVKAEQSLLN